MSSLRKIAEAKKANIRADAERKVAEIDHDMEELERLTSKYGLSVTPPTEAEKDASPAEPKESAMSQLANINKRNGSLLTTPSHSIIAEVMADLEKASITKRARVAAAAYIREKKRPVPLAELDEALVANGIQFESEMPRNTLSAVLGQDPNLYSISRDRGWWLKDLGEPPEVIRRRII
jgi:hypothetical protein